MSEFYFDECVLGAAKLLIGNGLDVLHPGHAELSGVGLGAQDTVWMPKVAAAGLIAVTRDRRINRNRGERRMIRAEGLKVLWFTGRADMRSAEQARLFRSRVESIRGHAADLGQGPWGLGLSNTGRLRVIRLE
jgi:hypothetical protein